MSATDAAAIAAVIRWRDGFNRMMKTHSSVPFRKVFLGSCSSCIEQANILDHYFSEGAHAVGGAFHLAALDVSEHHPDSVVVHGILNQDASELSVGKYAVVRYGRVTNAPMAWTVSLNEGRWLIADAKVLR